MAAAAFQPIDSLPPSQAEKKASCQSMGSPKGRGDRRSSPLLPAGWQARLCSSLVRG